MFYRFQNSVCETYIIERRQIGAGPHTEPVVVESGQEVAVSEPLTAPGLLDDFARLAAVGGKRGADRVLAFARRHGALLTAADPLDKWQVESAKLAGAKVLWEAIVADDADRLHSMLEPIATKKGGPAWRWWWHRIEGGGLGFAWSRVSDPGLSADADIRTVAKLALSRELNRQLADVRYRTFIASDGAIAHGLLPLDLLSAIWLRFSFIVTGAPMEERQGLCRICGQPFTAKKAGAVGHEKCLNRERQRRHRAKSGEETGE